MKRDIDYVVKDGEILIVDEFTGRIMLGRRYSEESIYWMSQTSLWALLSIAKRLSFYPEAHF